MATVRASESGLRRVDQARRIKKWNQDEDAWFGLALTSKATLKRFWLKKPINADVFESICKAVGIEDWQTIADLPTLTPATAPISFSVYNRRCCISRAIDTNCFLWVEKLSSNRHTHWFS